MRVARGTKGVDEIGVVVVEDAENVGCSGPAGAHADVVAVAGFGFERGVGLGAVIYRWGGEIYDGAVEVFVGGVAEAAVVAGEEGLLRADVPEQAEFGGDGPFFEADGRGAFGEVLVKGVVGDREFIMVETEAPGGDPALAGVEVELILREKRVAGDFAIGDAFEGKIFANEDFIEKRARGAVVLGKILVAGLFRGGTVEAPEDAVRAAGDLRGALDLDGAGQAAVAEIRITYAQAWDVDLRGGWGRAGGDGLSGDVALADFGVLPREARLDVAEITAAARKIVAEAGAVAGDALSTRLTGEG